MKVFVDTNVVVDYLTRRNDFYRPAAIVFDMARRNMLVCVVSSLTIVNCAYVMRKHFGKEATLAMLEEFMQTVDVSPIDRGVLELALESKPYDFEDSVQYHSSNLKNVDVIITRDERGFRDFDTPVMTPTEFLQNC